MINRPIDYSLLAKAVDLYSELGYTMVNVDWLVPPKYSYATMPEPGYQFRTLFRNGYAAHLVGSAEQGFLYEVAKGTIEYDKKYMSITPCFRRGDGARTPVHNEWFMKLELSLVSETCEFAYTSMISDAFHVFRELGAKDLRADVAENGFTDIMGYTNPDQFEIELGSYGYRDLNLFAKDLQKEKILLHYGTGLALPRFQLVTP